MAPTPSPVVHPSSPRDPSIVHTRYRGDFSPQFDKIRILSPGRFAVRAAPFCEKNGPALLFVEGADLIYRNCHPRRRRMRRFQTFRPFSPLPLYSGGGPTSSPPTPL